MASFINGLQQAQQDTQDANAYRALVRQAEDDSLAKSAAMQTKAAYDNAHIGYGLSRADIAKATGRPTSEVSMDTLSDAELQQLGFAKQASQKAALEAMASVASGGGVGRDQQVVNPNPISPEDAARQASMQQAAADMSAGRLGLAGQMTGRANPAVAQRFLDSIPTPGSFEMNANKQPIGRPTGEITDVLPSTDQEIKNIKAKGAY